MPPRRVCGLSCGAALASIRSSPLRPRWGLGTAPTPRFSNGGAARVLAVRRPGRFRGGALPGSKRAGVRGSAVHRQHSTGSRSPLTHLAAGVRHEWLPPRCPPEAGGLSRQDWKTVGTASAELPRADVHPAPLQPRQSTLSRRSARRKAEVPGRPGLSRMANYLTWASRNRITQSRDIDFRVSYEIGNQ
jgi:hypothetical protein